MPVYEYECRVCGKRSSILFRNYSSVDQSPRCRHCDAEALSRLVTRLAPYRASSRPDGDGPLRAVDPRRAVESMSRQYDKAGVDPGRSFEAVARRAAAGDSPESLKEMVAEARASDPSPEPQP